MTDQPTVALLGTGTMGAGIARNIAAARIPLTVWNRTRSKAEPLAEAGIEVADTPADAVRDADLVVTMLFDVESVESALDAARDGLKQGAVLVQQSTVGVAGADALAARAAELGLVYVDAPVLGTKKPAEDGALVILASGPDEVRDALAPLFDAIGSRTVWVGEAGQGTRLKLVANSWVLTVVEGIAESLALAKALGVEPRQFLDVVKGGAMDAPYVQLKGAAMLDGNFAPSFGLDGAAKDAALIVEAARAAGADLAVIEAVQQHFARALDAGHGDQDIAATFLEH
jgi:3-hydroxyisobutyrate dehydrogenase